MPDSIDSKVNINVSDELLGRIKEALGKPSIEGLKFYEQIGVTDSEEARQTADWIYDHGLPAHTCYENDRFYIAHRFNLSAEKKKESTLRLIINGMVGYFEPTTHQGFSLGNYLMQNRAIRPKKDKTEYQFLEDDEIRGIAIAFGISHEELEKCAYIACEFGLGKGYNASKPKSENQDAICASTKINSNVIQHLAETYLSDGRKDEILQRLSNMKSEGLRRGYDALSRLVVEVVEAK